MKFRVMFKTPDAVSGAVGQVVHGETNRQLREGGQDFDEEEFAAAADHILHNAIVFTRKWVKYGEYVTIEFDTEAGTATVIPTGG